MDGHRFTLTIVTAAAATMGVIIAAAVSVASGQTGIRQDLRSFQETTAAALREAAAERAEIRERLARIEALMGVEHTAKQGQPAGWIPGNGGSGAPGRYRAE